MTNSNFFLVNRALLTSDRWLSEPFTRGQAWVDMFGLAQHTDGFFRVRGIKVDVLRGQLAYSQVSLAERWKWSRGKVIRYLEELEKGGDIVQQSNEVTTLITIVKYDFWQRKEQVGDTTSDTTDGQQKDSKRYTYNKGNNENNENKGNNTEGESVAIAPTPSQEAAKFFSSLDDQEELKTRFIEKGYDEKLVRKELEKFVSYWTELNASGKRQRWQMEKTFEVGRRIATWLGKAGNQQQSFIKPSQQWHVI